MKTDDLKKSIPSFIEDEILITEIFDRLDYAENVTNFLAGLKGFRTLDDTDVEILEGFLAQFNNFDNKK